MPLKIIFSLFIWLIFHSHSQAQAEKGNFILNGSVGMGFIGATAFDNQKISDYGYSDFSGGIQTEVGLGYAITDYLSVMTGVRIEAFSQRFIYLEEEYSYSGGRYLLPVSFTVFYSDKDFRPFVNIGGYFIFSTTDDLINRTSSKRMAQPFGNYGLQASLGFTREFKDNWNYIMKFQLTHDEAKAGLKLTGFGFSTGIAWCLF